MNHVSVSNKCYQHPGNRPVVDMVPGEAVSVLDVGCGAGDNARLLKGHGMVVDGITLSESEAEIARMECRKVWLHNLEQGLPVEAGGPYDAVLCSHVLEHLCFPGKLLDDIHRILNPGGALLVALPNMLFYKNRFKLLMGKIEYRDGGLMDETHFRWYTFASAQELFTRHGFTRVEARGDGSLPLPGLRRIVPAKFAASLDRVAVASLPGLFAFQMLFHYRR